MTFLFGFLIFSIILIFLFFLYIQSLFNTYNKKHDEDYKETLSQVKDSAIFQQLVNGNTVSRIVINSSLDIETIKEKVKQAEDDLKNLQDNYNDANLENQIEELKNKSMILKRENDSLNNQLISLENELENILNTINVFQIQVLSKKNKNKSKLLENIYSGMNDSFNIIYDNSN